MLVAWLIPDSINWHPRFFNTLHGPSQSQWKFTDETTSLSSPCPLRCSNICSGTTGEGEVVTNENMAAYRTLCKSGLLELLNVSSRKLIMILVLVRMSVGLPLQMPNIFLFFIFCLFRGTPMAHGSSQARDRIGDVAASLHHSHSNMRVEPYLRPTPQLTAKPDP